MALKLILYWFKISYGLKITVLKSSVILLREDIYHQQKIALMLNYQVGKNFPLFTLEVH